MQKQRYSELLGLLGKESNWQYAIEAMDFSQFVTAGAITARTGGVVIPLLNPSAALKSPDAYPSDQPGGKLLAASGGRPIGTGAQPFAVLTGVFVAHVTAGGAVYQPAAGTTMQIRSISAAATVGGAVTNLTAAFNLATAANFLDQIPITAPAERQLSLEGAPLLTTVAALYNGDIIWAELVSTGALNVLGNLLCVFLEFGF